MQTGQRIFKGTDMHFFLDKIWKLLHITCFSPINCRKVINFQKQSTFFWTTLYLPVTTQL